MIVKLQPTEDGGALLHLDENLLQKLGVETDGEIEVSVPLSSSAPQVSEATAEEVDAALGRVNSAYGNALRRLGQ